jgi:pimeloyl-ACP methyl ester carboxylesterase
MKVYFISGLAADGRVFKYIQLPSHCEAVFLEWIPPLEKETLQHYAGRMAEKINAAESFAIIGLSMGGMMATEITKRIKPQITILISSIPLSEQLPFYLKAAGALGLHRVVPLSFLKSAAVARSLFSLKTAEEKDILIQTIKESDSHFTRWAMNAILKWDNEALPAPYIHIHGTKDKTLPIRFTKPTHIIQHAGHAMVINRAKEINAILAGVLTS